MAEAATTKPELFCYDDDACLGQKAPSLASLDFCQGDAVDVGAGKVTVVLFWAKFAKGDFSTGNRMSDFARKYKDDVQFVGVSCDPKKEHVEKHISRLGTFMKESVNMDGGAGLTLELDMPAGFDAGSAVKNAYKSVSCAMSLTPGWVFIVDKEGVIRWRDYYSRGNSAACVEGSPTFEDQLKKVIAGEELAKNGPKPEEDDSDEESDGQVAVVNPLDAGDDY